MGILGAIFRYVFCRCSVVDIVARCATRQLRSVLVTSTRGEWPCFVNSISKEPGRTVRVDSSTLYGSGAAEDSDLGD